MKPKQLLTGLLTGLLLAAGCATKEEPVYFASATAVPAPPDPAKGVKRGLPKADEKKILLAVYSQLLERNPKEAGECSALFVQADDDVVSALMKKYPAHVPPLKPGERLDLRSKKTPLDKDTGKSAIILGVEAGEPNADGSVEAVGRWYVGGAERGFSIFTLKKTGDDWTISGVK